MRWMTSSGPRRGRRPSRWRTGRGTPATQRLRACDILLPDARRRAVPFISGASIRHSLRAALAWHLARTLEVPAGSLSKLVVDLLWSGGSLTSTGSGADLAMSRRVHSTAPHLGAFGYSARSDIVAGTLTVRNANLVCRENAGRLPPRLAGHPHAALRSGAMKGFEFGTRHDVAGTAVDRYIALLDGAEAAPKTTQMIFDLQVLKPGSTLWGAFILEVPTLGHIAALATAIGLAAPVRDGRREMTLGGKRSTGYGTCLVEVGDLTPADIAAYRREYEAHLLARRGEIVGLLREVTGG